MPRNGRLTREQTVPNRASMGSERPISSGTGSSGTALGDVIAMSPEAKPKQPWPKVLKRRAAFVGLFNASFYALVTVISLAFAAYWTDERTSVTYDREYYLLVWLIFGSFLAQALASILLLVSVLPKETDRFCLAKIWIALNIVLHLAYLVILWTFVILQLREDPYYHMFIVLFVILSLLKSSMVVVSAVIVRAYVIAAGKGCAVGQGSEAPINSYSNQSPEEPTGVNSHSRLTMSTQRTAQDYPYQS